MTPEQIDRIRQSFASQSMMATLGARLKEVSAGTVTIEAPILATTRQQHGAGHAALTFAIGDSAAGYAALSLMGLETEVMTAEIKINLLAPAVGDLLIAKGRVIKPGRRLMVVGADILARTGESEVLIAVMLGTMVPVAAG